MPTVNTVHARTKPEPKDYSKLEDHSKSEPEPGYCTSTTVCSRADLECVISKTRGGGSASADVYIVL